MHQWFIWFLEIAEFSEFNEGFVLMFYSVVFLTEQTGQVLIEGYLQCLLLVHEFTFGLRDSDLQAAFKVTQ